MFLTGTFSSRTRFVREKASTGIARGCERAMPQRAGPYTQGINKRDDPDLAVPHVAFGSCRQNAGNTKKQNRSGKPDVTDPSVQKREP